MQNSQRSSLNLHSFTVMIDGVLAQRAQHHPLLQLRHGLSLHSSAALRQSIPAPSPPGFLGNTSPEKP
ncbi:MAG: hypothetical protein MI924_22305 [Chloroflexales bacterium]|nr:hypothetical protein [Chloroflexales bacterium]